MKTIAALTSLLLLPSLLGIACSENDGDAEAGTPGAAATTAFDDATEFRVRLEYPASWERDPDYDLRFGGNDGFVSITAQEGPGGLQGNTDAIAKHKLQPYGSDPEVEHITVDGADAMTIRPSADQHADLRGQVALVIQREAPMSVRGETYTYLVIEADEAHFDAIMRSISLTD